MHYNVYFLVHVLPTFYLSEWFNFTDTTHTLFDLHPVTTQPGVSLLDWTVRERTNGGTVI